MSIIDRYIAGKFLLFFLGGLIVFATIFLAFDSLTSMVRHDVGSDVLIRFYTYYLPAILYQMIPVACLIATVFTLSSLNRSQELVALFSVGMSLARVSLPILVMVALVAGFNFWMGDRLIPKFNQKKNFVYYVEIKKRPGLYSTVKTNKIWYRSENVLFNIKTLNAEKATAQGLSLYYFDAEWNLIQLIAAKTVHMAGSTWELDEGTVTLFAKESSFPLTKSFDKKVIEMNEEVADLQSSESSSDTMSLNSLSKFIAKNKEAGLDTLRYEVDFHSKMSFPFAALVMSLMGLPFSVTRQRSGGTFLNVSLCIGLAFVYWTLYSSAITLGRHGAMPPFIAAWAPNLLMTIGAAVLFLRLRK
ncbi:MAG: LPS export ABC transporter permease LptG [Bdellovibrionaceae bacterium]|nr:LPS export ABC transporter permease LptG [Bdellovibrionales bacterium]MCB9084492.1 LPS export ABC transporter permease LptG [Pseudobdellovibrionaceae bacterium]